MQREKILLEKNEHNNNDNSVESIRKGFQDNEIDPNKTRSRRVYDNLVNISFQRGGGDKSQTQKDSNRHERAVIEYFKELGFLESITSKKINGKKNWYYKERKTSVTHINKAIRDTKYECENIEEIEDGLHIVWQIRGTQDNPDCTLLNVIGNIIKIFPIECKLCSGLIKWNDNIPSKPYFWYHVINSETNNRCIFPGGNKYVIHPVIVKSYDEYKKELKEFSNKWKKNFKDLETETDEDGNTINSQGFSVYPRKNYTQAQRKDLNYDYTEYSEEIKSEWKKEFVEDFTEFLK